MGSAEVKIMRKLCDIMRHYAILCENYAMFSAGGFRTQKSSRCGDEGNIKASPHSKHGKTKTATHLSAEGKRHRPLGKTDELQPPWRVNAT